MDLIIVDDMEPAMALDVFYKLVVALCSELADYIHRRSVSTYPNEIKQIGMCMNIRKLCTPLDHPVDADIARVEAENLHALYSWAKRGLNEGGGQLVLGTWSDLWNQHKTVKSKIQALFATEKFNTEWKHASGVDIMEYMFTTSSLCADPAHPVKSWLYLFNHCILKTRCEAVVEGMGCVLDQHADPQRHLSMDQFTAEAIIHWNGLATQECDHYLYLALNEHFGNKPWNFHRIDIEYVSMYANGPKLNEYLHHPKYRSKFPWWVRPQATS